MSLELVDIDEARTNRQSNSSKQRAALGSDLDVYDEAIADIVTKYLDEIDPKATGCPAPEPYEVKREILQRTNSHLEALNLELHGPERYARLKTLLPSQIASILVRLHHCVMISAQGIGSSRDYDSLAIYVDHGADEGLYVPSDNRIGQVARTYNRELTINGTKEIIHILRESAPQVVRSTDRDLVPCQQGIFDYASRTMLPFSPEHILLSKNRTRFNPHAESPVIIEPDGSTWEVEAWMKTIVDDPELEQLLWELIGAAVRPLVRWGKTAWFYNEGGNNGKGTLCELIRQVIGEGSVASLPLKHFGKDFRLEPLINASAIIVDENAVGTFIDDVAELKAIVTNDIISINRKGRIPINYRFWGLMIQCLNEFPQIRDRSDSFYRRQLFVPFEKSFEGAENKAIKDNYLQRKDVHEYVLKKVLLDLPEYYVLSEPEATKKVLAKYKEANDPVREFWSEHEEAFVWDLLPFSFLYDVYKAWYGKVSPSGKVQNQRTFTTSLLNIIRLSSTWHCKDRDTAVRPGNRMSTPELLIQKYDLSDWKRPGYTGNNIPLACTPVPASKYRGIERYVSSGASTDTATDDELDNAEAAL
ncbi:MAG TPA: phage/plasmid primase, P4 family [Candidatus Lumbricidophila sp.]|nr:phage/plasmid primase, P4 family [Candidatus Lumbricidophila sp.]